MGMLSYQAIGRLHCGQRERGRTMDSPAGRRAMTTFKNEPMSAPKTPAYVSTSSLGRAAMSGADTAEDCQVSRPR